MIPRRPLLIAAIFVAIVTLFVLMQATARVDWTRALVGDAGTAR